MPGIWEKGGPSPNPQGRAPGHTPWAKMFREHCPEAKDVVLAYMRGDADKLNLHKPVQQDLQLKAALEVLDRGQGKPKAGWVSEEDPLYARSEDEQVEAVVKVLEAKGLRVVKGGK